jgi:protein MAK16
MQAACNQDHAVSDKNGALKITTTVRARPLSVSDSFKKVYLTRPTLIGVKKKLDRRETVRERKALSAAHLERSIQAELLERLKSKAYGDAPLNVNESVWQAILDREVAGNPLTNSEREELSENEGEIEEDGLQDFVSDVSGDEDDGLSDLDHTTVSS